MELKFAKRHTYHGDTTCALIVSCYSIGYCAKPWLDILAPATEMLASGLFALVPGGHVIVGTTSADDGSSDQTGPNLTSISICCRGEPMIDVQRRCRGSWWMWHSKHTPMAMQVG